MPYKDPEKRKQRSREYHMENRDKIRERNKQHYQKNKDKIKEYHQTPQGIKSCRITNWKKRGVVCDDFDAMYDHYTKTAFCDICRCELSIKKERSSNTKCLDHCHDTGLFRNILCLSCNVKRK
jgi:hypothetical protein